MRMIRSLLILATLVACTGDPTAPRQPARYALAVVEGDVQRAVVGTALKDPVTVRVTDAESRQAVPQTIVNWFRISGGDTVFTGAALTTGAGQAQMVWTLLPRAGTQKLIAWALDENGERVAFTTATADAVPDRAAAIATAAGLVHWRDDTVQVAALVNSVVDRYGNTVADAQLTVDSTAAWHPVAGGKLRWTSIGLHNVAITSDTAAGLATVTVLRDLRKLRGWTFSYACGDTALALPARSWDYMRAEGIVDSVKYAAIGIPVNREWVVYATTRWWRHTDREGEPAWDTTTTVTERLVITGQNPSGGLRFAYREALAPGTSTRIHRSDFNEAEVLPWTNDAAAFSGGNGCLFAWNPTEPFTPITLMPPLAP